MVNEVSEADFPNEVLKSSTPVVVDFWAQWCGPCKMLGPIFEELSKDYKDKVKFVKFNVDMGESVPGEYGVMSIPTLIMFHKGKEVERVIGALPKDRLKSVIDSMLKKTY